MRVQQEEARPGSEQQRFQRAEWSAYEHEFERFYDPIGDLEFDHSLPPSRAQQRRLADAMQGGYEIVTAERVARNAIEEPATTLWCQPDLPGAHVYTCDSILC